MRITGSGAESNREIRSSSWGRAFSNASGYCGWLVLGSALSFCLFSAGALLIRWGMENIDARENFFALGLGLATWGWLLVLVTGIVVWVKVSSKPIAQPA